MFRYNDTFWWLREREGEIGRYRIVTNVSPRDMTTASGMQKRVDEKVSAPPPHTPPTSRVGGYRQLPTRVTPGFTQSLTVTTHMHENIVRLCEILSEWATTSTCVIHKPCERPLGHHEVMDQISPTHGNIVTKGLTDFGISGQNQIQAFRAKSTARRGGGVGVPL